MDKHFWQHKKLADFTEEEWEAVCMRCGKCCLFKYLDDNKVCFSNKICDDFDLKTGSCSCYKTRLSETCLKVDMQLLSEQPETLPETCAYRLLLAGKELPAYHPLVSGNPKSVHEAKQTVLEIPEVFTPSEFSDFNEKLIDGLLSDETTEEELEELQKQAKRYDLIYITSNPYFPRS